MGLKDWSLKALKTEHWTAPLPNLQNRSHIVGTVGLALVGCVNLLLHVDTTLPNYIGYAGLPRRQIPCALPKPLRRRMSTFVTTFPEQNLIMVFNRNL